MDEKKVILLAVLILIISLISFNLGSGITGGAVSNTKTQIILDKNSVTEGGTIKVTVMPGSKGIANSAVKPTTPMYLEVYRELGGRVNSVKLKVCDQKRCFVQKGTPYLKIPADIIKDKNIQSARYYISGFDVGTGQEVRSYFTVINKDKVTYDLHR
ncbi:MAG: hypothetical protein AABX29_07875 [Nanoarchaeota archaeon]